MRLNKKLLLSDHNKFEKCVLSVNKLNKFVNWD